MQAILLSFELRALESRLRQVLGDMNVVHEASTSTVYIALVSYMIRGCTVQ